MNNDNGIGLNNQELAESQNIEEQIQLQQLINEKNNLLLALSNPLTLNKKRSIDNLKSIDYQLIDANLIPYFCKKCHYMHKSGAIYQSHKIFAQVRLKLPRVNVPRFKNSFKAKMVGIYALNSGSLVNSIPNYSELILKVENSQSNTLISVFHNNHKLGYLYKKNASFFKILNAINMGNLFKVYLKEYIPKIERKYSKKDPENPDKSRQYTCWDAEHAFLEVEIFDKELFWNIFQGLLELVDLGHRDLNYAFKTLGPRCLKHLEPHNNYLKEIKQFLVQFQKINGIFL